MTDAPSPAFASGAPKRLLRLEALVVLVAAIGFYWFHAGGLIGWWGFLIFFAPDLSIAAYAVGPKFGAGVYNAAHTYLAPVALAAIAALPREPTGWLLPCAILWVGHIGMDRTLGFGLKYSTSCADTHLGRIGRGS